MTVDVIGTMPDGWVTECDERSLLAALNACPGPGVELAFRSKKAFTVKPVELSDGVLSWVGLVAPMSEVAR